MRQGQDFVKDMLAKITDVDRLPTHEEALRLLNAAKAMKSDRYIAWIKSEGTLPIDINELAEENREWLEFYGHMPFNNLYNAEFVGDLADEIRRLDAAPVIEICAGDGKLSHQLRKRWVEITATDDYSWNLPRDEKLVEKLSHLEALEKYKPLLVVGSWIEFPEKRQKILSDILGYPSVQYLIDIEDYRVIWPKDICEGWEKKCLETVERYSISNGHFIYLTPSDWHSCVSLFRRNGTGLK